MPAATVLVLLGDQLSTAYQAAQLAQGNFAPSSVTVSDLFAGAIIPGFSLVALYILYLIFMAVFFPKTSPAIPPEPGAPKGVALARRVIEVLIAPIALILAVLGSILAPEDCDKIAEAALKALGPIEQRPVMVRSNRTGNGRVIARKEYDSEGFVAGDNLNPQKARILLMLALTQTRDINRIRRMFREY